ncbi:MAG: hypothetical protein WA628_21835 [Terriglobales bacterium]
MQVDFAVELGRDDETLELPWAASDGGPRYYDLKLDPQALAQIEEAVRSGELREFLGAVNSPASVLESAKCDTWSTDEINPEEEIFGAPWKFGSYVDLLFTNPRARFSFEDHENLLKELTKLLQRVPDIPAAAEFLLRRCHYHGKAGVRDGFYVTLYVFGYGEDEAKARRQWEIALKLVGNAVTQLSSRHPTL